MSTVSAHPVTIKRYSCVLCSQRKVKCDRKQPCVNCVKARVECVPSNPNPPRRRKRTDEPGLHERLQRCEDLLKTYGLSIHDENAEKIQNGTQPGAVPSEDISSTPNARSTHGRMISNAGMTRFVENQMWANLLDELREFKDMLQQGPVGVDDESDTSDTSTGNGSQLVFSSALKPSKLAQLHPTPMQILGLWQIFLENVNPLLKIVHIPTLQPKVLEASGDIANIPKNLEALLFGIYTLAIISLSEEDCLEKMGESSKTLTKRYLSATEQALIRLGTLESSDLVVLQALSLFLVGVRSERNSQAFWILCGVAIRVAQRMGVHRDGTLVEPKLPPFETEMRRRIWWHAVKLDFLSTVHSGMGPSLLDKPWDTRVPGNFNDGDLYPDMEELPPEHKGATEMIYPLVMYDMCQAFSEARAIFGFPSSIPLPDADKWFNELETRMRKKFLQYCDLDNPLHLLSEATFISVIASKRLYSHHPRNQPPENTEKGRLAQVTLLFENSMTVLRYYCVFHSVKSVKKFQWHTKGHFQYDTFVSLLAHLRQRTLEPESKRGWDMVQDIYKCHGALLSPKANELHVAISELALKAWEARELALQATNQPVETPDFILALRLQRSIGSDKCNNKAPNVSNMPYPAGANPGFIYNQIDAAAVIGPTWGLVDFDSTTDGNNNAPTDMTQMDWEYWDNLFREYDIQAGDTTKGLMG